MVLYSDINEYCQTNNIDNDEKEAFKHYSNRKTKQTTGKIKIREERKIFH